MAITGENLVPLGRAGSGAAYILGNNGAPNPLSVLISGQRTLAHDKLNREKMQAKADADAAKNYNDTVKFDQSGDPFFADGLEGQVYSPLNGQLNAAFVQHRDDALARNAATRPLLQKAANETKQADAKGKFLREQLAGFHGDRNLYDEAYAGTNLSAALRDGERRKLPSEFDAETWADTVKADHNLYKESEVVRRTTKNLFPIISQKVAEAGQLGGQHSADQVRGRFVAFDGKGRPVLNADGSPKLNLTAATDELLDADPLFKLKTDARVADYEAKREASVKAHEADPTAPVLPIMTRRGHHAMMIGPLAFYDTTKDEGLNAQVPRPRAAAKVSPSKVVVSDFVGSRQSDYMHPTRGQQTNHYAEVGQSFGSATKPYVELSVPTANMTVIGQDGKPTTTNPIKGGGNTKVNGQVRAYVLYTKTGKRLGRPESFATDQEAADYALKIAREYHKPQDLELRIEGRGTVVDVANTAGDGLGGGVPQVYVPAKGAVPAHMAPDKSVSKTEHTVLFPITQEIDNQLTRATNNEWKHTKATPAQNALIREVTKRGGKFVSPYHSPSEPEKPTSQKPKPQRPAFLQPTTGKKTTKTTTKTQVTPAADLSGGML